MIGQVAVAVAVNVHDHDQVHRGRDPLCKRAKSAWKKWLNVND